MLTRYRKRQKYLMSILLVFTVFASVGFAAFSDTLVISANAIVKPNSSSFRVVFSSSETELLTEKITGVGVNGAVAGTATIDNDGETPTISDLTATFTALGQTVTYTFYSYNAGAYIAYLDSITFNYVDGESLKKVCTTVNSAGVTDALLTAACDDITLKVNVGDILAGDSLTGISKHSLAKTAFEKVVVTIEYENNNNSVDGDFFVEFGDIGLTYSSRDNESSE